MSSENEYLQAQALTCTDTSCHGAAGPGGFGVLSVRFWQSQCPDPTTGCAEGAGCLCRCELLCWCALKGSSVVGTWCCV